MQDSLQTWISLASISISIFHLLDQRLMETMGSLFCSLFHIQAHSKEKLHPPVEFVHPIW
jgi:hypothetical protein